MKNSLKMNLIPIVLLILVALANCVPTSVLVNTKDSKASNLKVKRSSSLNTQTSAATSGNHKAGSELHLSSGKSEVSLGTRQPSESAMEHKAAPQKRGVNSQLMYSDLFNDGTSNMAAGVPNGVWGDELDPALPYSDVQDFDEYQKGSYHRKPYDNLQSILNGEAYPEPFALPLQYPYRYYGDRKKRSNKKGNLDLRLKRESRLTPADMLALVALVEAGERSRQEAENQEALNDYTKSYLAPYNTQLEDENDWSNSWSDTPIDYYGMPYNLDSIPRYEIAKDQRSSSNYYPAKRYMIAKKKRSPGHFLNEPVPYPSISYGGHYGDVFGKGTNKYQKYF